MARLLFKALQQAGFAPRLASELRTWESVGDATCQQALRDAALTEADHLIVRWIALPPQERPRLWFTYHVYYKAPDWMGPRIADALAIPYAIAEGSRAGKRASGPWALGHQGAEAALDRADVVFAMTETDRDALERHRPANQRLVELPPFLDLEPRTLSRDRTSSAPALASERPAGARLLTVAMMRQGDKLASYGILADALSRIAGESWTLDILGDGEGRSEVERLFAPLRERVRFHGAVEDRAALAGFYDTADLFVWPAVNEAYGMVLLEAQAFGCPVVAGAYGGVPSVVRHDETGVLVSPGDADAFAGALGGLIRDPARRRALGAAGARFVAEERSLDGAAERLRAALMPLVAEHATP